MYIVDKEEFFQLETCFEEAYQMGDVFYLKLHDDVEPKEHWTPLDEEDFKKNRPKPAEVETTSEKISDLENKISSLEAMIAKLLEAQEGSA